VAVDPPRGEGDDAESPGAFENLRIEFLAQIGVEGFGVVYPLDLTLPQNDRRREQRSGQRAAPGLVSPC
jgi:hypothetical protein